jgi:hypothetical protein
MRPSPASFICQEGSTYRLRVPDTSGYSPFKHWRLARTDEIVGTSPTLELTVGRRNERYVAVYDPVRPVDLVFHATSGKEQVTIQASKPDINGKTELLTPGHFTYLSGTQVRFTAPEKVKEVFPDLLYGKIEEVRRFLRWEEQTALIGHDNSFEITVDRPRKFSALYAKTPAPNTPNDRQVHVIGQHLAHSIESTRNGREHVVIINNRIVPMFGRIGFPSERAARATIQAAVEQALPTWLNQLPQEWKEWMSNETQRQKFLDYWTNKVVRIVPLDQVAITAIEVKQDVDPKTNETGTNAAAVQVAGRGGRENIQPQR